MQCACAILSFVACPVVQYIHVISQNGTIFENEVMELELCFDSSLHLLSANIYHFKKNWVRYDQKCIFVFNKSTCNSCQILMKLEFLDRFSRSIQESNFMKIRPVGAELFHADERTDGRTDRHDEVNSCFSQFCERAFDWVCGSLKLRKTEIPNKTIISFDSWK
jgi:hypothetical protein